MEMGGGEPEEQDFGNEPEENEYGPDFDAGVEADENEDPKKYIQQLSGKLSQSLRKYNQELPKPDSELNKYVAGMINKSATEGLSQEDVKEIIDKINSDESDDEFENGNEKPDDNGFGDDEGMGPETADDTPNFNNESKISRKSKNVISELINDLIQQNDRETNDMSTDGGYASKIFKPKQFK